MIARVVAQHALYAALPWALRELVAGCLSPQSAESLPSNTRLLESPRLSQCCLSRSVFQASTL